MKDTERKFDLNLTKPTIIEVEQTKKLVKQKYGIDVPNADVKKLVQLIKELDWWMKVETKHNGSKNISEETVLEFKDLIEQNFNRSVTDSEAYDQVKGLLLFIPFKEKQRVADEIRAILVTHRQVPKDPVVFEKLTKLLSLRNNIKLTTGQLEQLIQLLSKRLWYEVGLDESLDKCLDILIVYADKIKRKKLVNDLLRYKVILQEIDLAVLDIRSHNSE